MTIDDRVAVLIQGSRVDDGIVGYRNGPGDCGMPLRRTRQSKIPTFVIPFHKALPHVASSGDLVE